MQSTQYDWDDCQFPDSDDFYWGFTINADNSFTAGNSTLQFIVSDIDGLRGFGEFSVEIVYGLPTILNQSGEVIEGEFGELSAIVSDSDGHIGTVCTFIIVDKNGTTAMESEGPLPADGLFTARWMPQKGGAPFSSTIGCTDAQGHQVAHTRPGITPLPAVVGDDGAANQSSTDGSSNLKRVFGLAFASLLIVALGATLLLMWVSSPEDELLGGEIDDGNTGWEAPADSRGEGEQNVAIAEMAMEDVSDVPSSDEGLAEVEEILHTETEEDQDTPLDWLDENPLLSKTDEPKD
jgi:hypothetical protein